MQISNQSILSAAYSDIGHAINHRQRAEQYSSAPVTIEGQIVDDKEKKKSARKLERENLSAEQTKYDAADKQVPDENQQQLVNLSTNERAEELGGRLLLQKQLSNSLTSDNFSPEQLQSRAEHIFPYSNRRSSHGLAGSSLIIQKYLNNEPDTTFNNGNSLFSRFI